jgi:hypothetical protein
MTPTPATEFFAALTDLLLGADTHPNEKPQSAPVAESVQPAMVWCTACGGSGEGHSAYADTVCSGCDGRR